MNKRALKAVFSNAKAIGARYVGGRIETAGSSQPEIIINPRENFDAKLNYYMSAYDDGLRLIPAKGKKDIRITGIAQGNTFEDIEYQLMSVGAGWKKPISDAIDKSYNKMIAETPPQTEEERLRCERFIFENIEKYEQLFDICMNGDDMEFRKGLTELQRMQNEHILKEESSK